MNATVIDADEMSFETTVLSAIEPLLVEFWAEWCPPCKRLAPIIAELAIQYQGSLRVVRVDSDANPALVSRWGIAANPTLLFFRHGQEVHRLVGAWP
jgi:thioredoxin 1